MWSTICKKKYGAAQMIMPFIPPKDLVTKGWKPLSAEIPYHIQKYLKNRQRTVQLFETNLHLMF